ncbi:DNA polymerase III subunit epsilon [Sphingomonas sp. PAMC26645]|uniref:3'-5' exonuclease n=1 Tax=Sphingomonas sp. PAMC26645 TaxID=2565555 RepID=UPI00109DBB6A|nr:3'-5' exonuclease [Sphingomonas sp. PAMC26645]QCB43262.1 DNA polymerase III subunit epsilon [Sphingomonas sp. PAMC26645]
MASQINLDSGTTNNGSEVRILHPLKLREGSTGDGCARGSFVGVAVDVETTSLDAKTGKVIELALRRFRYDGAGIVTDIDQAFEWREDPGEPLTDEIRTLTGITDADLAGQEIDEDSATRLLQSASFVVAHNSAFDRSFIEMRLPEAKRLAWTCSLSQVDWRARGFDGRSLGYLLVQNGFYHCGHRASADVDALIQMLRHRNADGRTALAEMIERGSQSSWLVSAKGADFSVKDLLKQRGYRWSSGDRVWWREVDDKALKPERFWLAANVYCMEANPKATGPTVDRVTPRTRFLQER